MPIGPGRDCRQ